MTFWQAIAVTAAGFAAGGVNAIVGSGSLITFPVLLAVGYPSVVANVSNTVGLVPGGISGVIGYRRELKGQRRRAITLACGTSVGALIGGILLLELPDAVFDAVVPILILLAVVLMAIKRTPSTHADVDHTAAGTAAAFSTGIYGGYFGAAQGIILMSLLRFCFPDDLQRLNALKNVLAGVANGVAAILFIAVADVAWEAAGLIAVGSVVGAQVGARYGRHIPSEVLRWIVVIGGAVVAVILLVTR
ncbi:sulfite exporter TauE/SafE family protein [Solirubrobacter ginsenosidimutans]|uniref:Probable membrane transporter protein n=1 Tax=Solirubrobacter ginsenosidimutans TaxID=490573 RepID=A0A9X3MZT5_9ACTN|nr:sulfite exporter TauE/SafE family protein [Solirubrobacter ginsenosidimutans]MDA0164696.1 sulfite exporter TauE/SafE family protein [Solirubrobacter ginsenosidimutans]